MEAEWQGKSVEVRGIDGVAEANVWKKLPHVDAQGVRRNTIIYRLPPLPPTPLVNVNATILTI